MCFSIELAIELSPPNSGFAPFFIAGTNVSFRKPVNQSTTIRGGDANHGNDGDFGTEHDGKRCTETQSEPSPWWKVDLLKPFAVKVVRVTTRGCCGKPIVLEVKRINHYFTNYNFNL